MICYQMYRNSSQVIRSLCSIVNSKTWVVHVFTQKCKKSLKKKSRINLEWIGCLQRLLGQKINVWFLDIATSTGQMVPYGFNFCQ